MTDLAILQELGLALLVPREPEAPAVIQVIETRTDFSEAHHSQLSKIMDYLGYTPTQYQIFFAGEDLQSEPLLSFGITTHSITAMLQNPAVKREVLHAIQAFRRNT